MYIFFYFCCDFRDTFKLKNHGWNESNIYGYNVELILPESQMNARKNIINKWHPKCVSINEFGWMATITNMEGYYPTLCIWKPKGSYSFQLYGLSPTPWSDNTEFNSFDRMIFQQNLIYIYKQQNQSLYFAQLNVRNFIISFIFHIFIFIFISFFFWGFCFFVLHFNKKNKKKNR